MDIHQITQLTQRERIIAATAAATGTVVGATATFVVLRKQIKDAVFQMETLLELINDETILEEDTNTIKHDPEALKVLDDVRESIFQEVDASADYQDRVFPDSDKPALQELTKELQYTEEDSQKEFEAGYTPAEQAAIEEAMAEEDLEEPEYEGVVPSNVFENELRPGEAVDPDDTPEWNYLRELAVRKRLQEQNLPYVIHVDEFRENETGYVQLQLTWYAGDEVLADERDTPVDAVDSVVGLENLASKFGHGSANSDILFIRNEKMNIEAEILRSDGKYSFEVLGNELQHSEPIRRVRRSRFDDES